MDDETLKALRRIADHVARAQLKMALSTVDLARMSGVAQVVIERLLRAEEDPGVEAIYRLAGALELTPGDLIQGIEWVPDDTPGGRWRVEGEADD